LQALSNLLGKVFKFIYESLVNIGAEPANISYYAIALLIMAVIYKLITIPLTLQSTKAQKKTQELQPQIEELKKKYGYDQQILNQKIQEFQKENNATAAGCSGCLMMVLQLVIVIALFAVVREPGKYLFDNPADIEKIRRNFFWINDLSTADPTGFVLALLNSLTQVAVSFLSQVSTGAESPQAEQTQKMMMYGMPIMFFFVFRTMPAGLVLYWVAGNIIEILFKGTTRLVGRNK